MIRWKEIEKRKEKEEKKITNLKRFGDLPRSNTKSSIAVRNIPILLTQESKTEWQSFWNLIASLLSF